MRTTKPRAIATIRRLIDWLNMALGTGSWKGRSEFDVVRPDRSHYNVLAQPRPDPIALRRISNTKQRRKGRYHRSKKSAAYPRTGGRWAPSGKRQRLERSPWLPSERRERTCRPDTTRSSARSRGRKPRAPNFLRRRSSHIERRGFLAAPRSRHTHFPSTFRTMFFDQCRALAGNDRGKDEMIRRRNLTLTHVCERPDSKVFTEV